MKVAVTAWFELIVTVQVPVPEHAPDHPAKAEPAFGVAVSVTTVPVAKLRQPDPHEVPAGEEPTVPPPVPDVVMVRFRAGSTVRDTGWQTEAPLRSTAQTVKLAVLATVGVPVSKPLRLRDIPIGGKPPIVPSWK